MGNVATNTVAEIPDAAYRAAARRMYESNDVEFDKEPAVSRGTDPGASVTAWVWVPNADANSKGDKA